MSDPLQTQAAFEERMTATLEHCLLQLAEALQSSFDPADPHCLQLLSHFRSTLAIRKRWLQSLEKDKLQESKTGVHSKSNKEPAVLLNNKLNGNTRLNGNAKSSQSNSIPNISFDGITIKPEPEKQNKIPLHRASI